MRKQLDLIFTALLPVIALAIGFFAINSNAGLNNRERANPTGAGPYYRAPGVNGQYFGAEINSDDLCGVVNGFDIYVTSESASVSAGNRPRVVNWYRFQRFDFTSDDTPWGTNSAEITYSGGLSWTYDVSSGGDHTTGYPWSGSESHSLHSPSSGDYVSVYGSVTGWKKETEDGTRYICPNYYKSQTTYRYYCNGVTDYGDLLEVKDSDFDDPEFHPDNPDTLSRWSQDTNSWHDCIEIM